MLKEKEKRLVAKPQLCKQYLVKKQTATATKLEGNLSKIAIVLFLNAEQILLLYPFYITYFNFYNM